MSVEVSDWNELDAMREDLEGEYILVNDLTPETDGYDDKASETANPLNDEGSWSSGTSYEFEDLVEHNGASYYCIKEHTSDSDSEPDEGEYWDDYWAETDKEAGDCLGWRPIGEGTDDVYRFSGVFDGDVHTIKGLTIDREDEVTVGLFSRTKSDDYGNTVGVFKNTLFEDVDIKGGSRTGTMVGRCGYRGQAFVEYVGVLSGTVEGEDRVGGITGNSSSSGTRIRHCFNFADIIGEDKVGGIVGRISANDSQANKNYSHGSVTGDTYVGGFNGQIHCMSDSNYNYATGEVNGNNNVGGITGYSRVSSDIDDSYWDTETTNQSSSACSSTGRTTSEMTGSSALTYMDDFDFSEDYHIVESDEEIAHDIIPLEDGYPILRPDSGWTTEQEEKWIEEQLKAQHVSTKEHYTIIFEPTSTGQEGDVQAWTVPEDGTYTITAWGSQGGGSSGGMGAKVSGDFDLDEGDELQILVGQQPDDVAGGGGGTFVAKGEHYSDATPLIVAGGGAGEGRGHEDLLDATAPDEGETESPGQPNVCGNYEGGTGGEGGESDSDPSYVAGAGGGFYTDGDDGSGSDSGGKSFVNGGVGGDATHGDANGGFGGGGGGYSGDESGGGGGYNGGAGGDWSTCSSGTSQGGGGGSYNIGDERDNEAGVNDGDGLVEIVTTFETPDVQTKPADNITTNSATLHGELTDLGTAGEVDVWFEYWEKVGEYTFEGSSEEDSDPETLTEPDTFDADLTDLEPDTEYEFRAVADGYGDVQYGDILSFTTLETYTLNVLPATNIGQNSATLNADVVTLGQYDSADIVFRVWEEPEVTAESGWGLMANEFVGVGGTEVEVITETGWDWDMSGDFMRVQGQFGYPFYTIKNVEDLGDDKYRIEIEEEFKLAIGGPQELIETLTEASGTVRSVAFGDGFIAYGSFDENVYVHNTDDFSLETTLTEATDGVRSVAFGDGFLAAGGWDNNVYVYDTSDFSLETTLTESTGSVYGVGFGDGFIAYGGLGGNVYVHNTDDFSLEETLTEATDHVWSVAFGDGFIAYGSDDNNVYVHDTSDFSLVQTLTEASGTVWSVAFTDGFIAYGSSDNNVYVHNTDDFSLEETLTEATSNVHSVAFRDGFIAYGSFDNNVYVHDLTDFSLEETLTEATDDVNGVAFGDSFIAYGGRDNNVYVHELEEFGDRIRIYDGLESDLQTITEEGQVQQNVSGLDKHTTYQYRIISYANDDIIHTFESAESPEYMEEQFTTGLLVSTTEPELYEDMAVLRGELEDLGYHDDADVWFEYSEDIYEALDFDHGVNFVDYSPDGQYVAISSDNIYIHETNEWTEVKEISGDGNAVWSPDNQYLAHEDGENVIIRDANDLDNIVETLGGIDEEYSLDINAISWSEDSNYISFGGIEGFERPLYIYKTSDWSLAERILDAQHAIRDISWSDDGQYVASANESGNVLIHVVGEWTLETTISEGGVAYTVDWSPGSDMIMHGTSDYVYIHNSSDWSLEETLTELDGHTLSVKWSPDGEFVVYGGGFDFNVYIHRTRNWSLADILTDATDNVWTVSYTDGYISYGSEENKLHITGSRKKTPDETIDYEGEFEYEIHDLEKRSSFKYDANAESDDDMVSGELVYFTLPIIETVDVSSFLNSINSMVDYMVQFGWRTTDPQTVTEPGDYSDLIEGLQPGSEYEFKAVAENETNVYDEGQVLTFMTNFYEAVSSFLGSSGSNIISRLSSVSKSACSLFKSITDFNFVFGRRVTSSIDTLTTIAEKIESTLKRSKTFVDNILSETYGAVRVVVIVKKFIDASRSISSRVKKVKRRVVSDLNNLLSLPKKSSINEFLIKHKVDPLTSNIIRYVDKIYEFAHYFDKILTETDGDYRSVTYVFVYVGKSVTSVSTLRNIKRSVISQSYDILSSINKMSILTKNTISYVKNITSDSQIVFRVSAYIKSCLSTGKLSFLITNISHIKNFVTSSIYDIPVSTSFLNAFASNVPSIIVKFRTVVSQAFDINSSSKRLIKIENKVISSVSKIITLSERMFYAFASTTSFSNTIVSLKASVFDKIRHVISVYHDNKTISKIKPRMVVRGFMRKFVSKSFLICLDPYQISISVEKRRYQKGKIIPINIRIYDQLGNPRNPLYKFSEDIKTKSESFIKKILSDK